MIRQIGIDELGQVKRTAQEFYAASRFLGAFSLARFTEVWTQLLSSGAGVIFTDERAGETVGAIGGLVHREIYSEVLIAEEFFWFVREEHRGAGVQLYRRFERWARDRGAESLQMVHLFDVMPEKVAKFYLHSGFEPMEMRYMKKLERELVRVIDDFLPQPVAYRARALSLEYKTVKFETCEFQGIAPAFDNEVPLRIQETFPQATPTLSFFRRSPEGQEEPHFIHTDADMGEWTAILYLNPKPPAGDGTTFWRHIESGTDQSTEPGALLAEGLTADGWKPRHTVEARFNRLVVFPASLYHSRAIAGNYGAGAGARLTQIVFGRGQLWQ